MDRNAIRTDDQRLERNRLIEYNRQKRAESNLTVIYLYIYFYPFLFPYRFNQLIFLQENIHLYYRMINHY
jgi:hypothetical protein